jgi:hypothetical protein
MGPREFRSEVLTRLLADVYPEDAWCPLCDAVLDKKGRHAAVCPCGGDRTRRHHAARNRTAHFAQNAGLNPDIEKPGLLQPSPEQPGAGRRRPADVFLPSWTGGLPAALDLAITSPHRADAPPEAITKAGATAQAYERTKRNHLNTEADCSAQGIAFIPIVGEPSGGWGPSAMCTLKAIARSQAASNGQEEKCILSKELQHLCTAIRRANARAVLRRGAEFAHDTKRILSAASCELAAADAAPAYASPTVQPPSAPSPCAYVDVRLNQ